MPQSKFVEIEFVDIREGQFRKVNLQMPQGSTIKDLFVSVGFDENYEGKFGIFGEVVPIHHVLIEGDRVEIYSSLLRDPKAKRLTQVSPSRLPRRCR